MGKRTAPKKSPPLLAKVWAATGREPHVALMTGSVVTRSMLTAFAWLLGGAKLKPTALHELDAALEGLKATQASHLVL